MGFGAMFWTLSEAVLGLELRFDVRVRVLFGLFSTAFQVLGHVLMFEGNASNNGLFFFVGLYAWFLGHGHGQ